jgi:hypothetical protein
MEVVRRRTLAIFRAVSPFGYLAAVVFLLGGATTILQGPAWAAGVPKPSGTLTCQLGGSMSFNPPLSPGNGTPGADKEEASITETLTGCVGTASTAVLVPGQATSVSTKTVKIKATKIGKTKYAGGCDTISGSLAAAAYKSKITWNNGIKGTRAKVAGKSFLAEYPAGSGESGLQATGTATGSFTGPVTSTAFFTDSSSQALQACIDGTGPSVSTLDIDETTSSWTDGTDVLSFGSLGGANVSVGDTIGGLIPGSTGSFLTCSSGSASIRVTANPTIAGSAILETTGLSLSGCMEFGSSADVTFSGLPSVPPSGSVSDAAGLGISLGTVSMAVSDPTLRESCGYSVDLSGGYSNATNAATFTNRPFTFTGGSLTCDESGSISFSMSPITDANDSGDPSVFVN